MQPGIPLISVIIVVYNGARTIAKALDSVMNQSFKDFELICIDGVSNDNTVEIIKSYGTAITRLISEPDKGIYDAMNKGIGIAKGEYLYFLGADDFVYNEHVFQAVANLIQQTNPDLLYGNVVFSNSGRIYGGEFSYEQLLTQNLPHQAAFYRRKLFGLLGTYNLEFPYHADWDFNLSCFSKEGITTVHINHIIAVFQVGNTSSVADITLIKARLIPAMLKYSLYNPRFFRKVRNFDYLWRFVRNANIRSVNDLGLENILLKKIIEIQAKIAPSKLKNGGISKSLMLSCYISCRLTKLI
jgi:glycosyltransferase involved in cell wall biosynthesis